MQEVAQERLSDIFRYIAADLDITREQYEDAVVKYRDVGEHLGAEDSPLQSAYPVIYPQGSFRLGTMVKPYVDSDEFDIDLVCHLNLKKESVTQAELKKRIGNRLKDRSDLKKILKESRRCWLLDYPEQFHMDVLPAIPNLDRLPNGILLTDTELRYWQHSSPKDYADWFMERQEVILLEKMATYAERYQMSIEDVPEFDRELKTPLQRTVQLLKRHRDIYFAGDLCNRPVSMVITTLAARAYGNQGDLYDALDTITDRMTDFIEKRENGEWWVENPVNEDENFADKWNDYPERRDAFFHWLKVVRQDVCEALIQGSLEKSARVLCSAFGESVVTRASERAGVYSPSSNRMMIKSAESVPQPGTLVHQKAPIWPVQQQYQSMIKTTVHGSMGSGKRLWTMTKKPIQKGLWLRFELKTKVPQPFEVYWQVTNTGKEAFQAGQPRGDSFEKGSGSFGQINWEQTAYRGTHFVTGFVVRNGICVSQTPAYKVRIRD
ncbi:nucleotidyltransferase [Rhodopirellula bahusiensis]|uniref:Adenylyl/Guanylyl and SMODS C-terminal sensor domain-containing protein n=1 Tax=Rhodopirellula bahusiensis TaxID=2014065 RepID=A0A2G1W5R1_9BACT|nr:nucleotidyltransferase [Rhodopirellula bahusiensis]PHQ34368.1 hypothetical protein CEE69_15230 [Rhodopirellula bahusiensis]